MYKVSICIPTYENVTGIKRLLESVLVQTFKDYEIVISDDSHTDNVMNAIKEYCDERIKYFRHINEGYSTANWNYAIQKSSGNYIKVMHHDDWFTDENSLAKFVQLLDDNPTVDIAFSGTRQVGEKIYERCINEQQELQLRCDYRYVFCHNKIGAPSATIFRKRESLFDEKLKWLVDSDFYLSVLDENSEYAFSREPLVSIGISDEQMTGKCINDRKVIVSEYIYVYTKHDLSKCRMCRLRFYEIMFAQNVTVKGLAEYGIYDYKYKIYYAVKTIKRKMKER